LKHLAEVLRFELAYQLRRTSTRIYFAIFLGITLLLTQVFLDDAREDYYYFNAPLIIAAVTVIGSMISLLVTAAMAGDAATRDAEVRLDALLFTTPLTKGAYLGGRFLGALTVTSLLLLAVPLGLLLATLLPNVEPALLGPFRAADYLRAYAIVALPNAFVSTALLFATAGAARRAIAAFATAIALFFASLGCDEFLGNHLGRWSLGQLVDPLAFTTIRALWKSSNAVQKNTRLLTLDSTLLANRMLWIALAASLLAVAWARFRFAYDSGARGGRATTIADAPPVRWSGLTVPAARRSFGWRTRLLQLRAIAFDSCRELHKRRGWLIVPLTAVLLLLSGPELLEVELGTPGAATTARVAMLFGVPETFLLFTLLIALAAGELVWREREARLDPIADAAPLPEWLTLLGKFLGLGLMLAAAQALLIVTGIVLQLVQGARLGDIELALYAELLLGTQLAGYLLVAALAMAVHVLVNQKYVAIVVTVLLAFFIPEVLRNLGVTHNLLLYASAPEPAYSEMSGFGWSLGPWCWFTLYWSGWALLLGAAAYLFWMRGEERSLRQRLAAARRRCTRVTVAIVAVAVTIAAGTGAFIFYNTNVVNSDRSDEQFERWRADYERRFGKYAALAQPSVAATKLQVDFYPRQRAASIRGSYRLENRSDVAIDAIHLVLNPSIETKAVTFDRASRLTLRDDNFGYRIYALARPLAPRQSLTMQFDVAFAPRGFTNEGYDSTVLPNGSWFEHRPGATTGPRRWLPFVGYQSARELDGAAARQQYGLRKRPAVPPLEDVAARQDGRGLEKIDFEAVIGTDGDQLGVAPGILQRTWLARGRRYARYVADAPISNAYAIFSARYAVHRARWRDVAIEIYHHPAHAANVQRMVRSVQASLEQNARAFAPYPHRLIRLIEFPSPGHARGSLTAHDMMIQYPESFALMQPDTDARRIDLPFAVIAHEMAHQWWGHRLVPARVEGAALLSESLAWYSGMRVVEASRGRDHLIRLLDIMRSQYFAPHQARRVPLLRITESIDAYRTGPFAMFALRETIGAERVDGALRKLLAKFDPARPPYPTSLDLYAELRAVTPAEARPLLVDLFENLTFWNLRTKRVEAQRAGGGMWCVTLHVEAEKLHADFAGNERPVPMDDLVWVAAFDADGKVIARRLQRIRSGAQVVTLTVARQPVRAGLDPDPVLLDREPDDNIAAIGD
jgi:ABC-type transport system involved in multi-copper enzyme maturation permease subunit